MPLKGSPSGSQDIATMQSTFMYQLQLTHGLIMSRSCGALADRTCKVEKMVQGSGRQYGRLCGFQWSPKSRDSSPIECSMKHFSKNAPKPLDSTNQPRVFYDSRLARS